MNVLSTINMLAVSISIKECCEVLKNDFHAEISVLDRS